MPLPSDLTPLDVEHMGMVFCDTVAKTSIDTFTMDIEFMGMTYVRNSAIVPPFTDSQNTIDLVEHGLPFVFMAATPTDSLPTMDFAMTGLPMVTNPVSTDFTFAVLTNTITITCPATVINGLLRKFPLVRDEFVSSENEAAHVFPYVTIQDPALIP